GRNPGELLSFGLVWGAIQLPPDRRPIVLLADHQTVGGYPVLATVVTADHPAIGQLAPGDPVRFAVVSIEQAQRLYREQRAGRRFPSKAIRTAGASRGRAWRAPTRSPAVLPGFVGCAQSRPPPATLHAGSAAALPPWRPRSLIPSASAAGRTPRSRSIPAAG